MLIIRSKLSHRLGTWLFIILLGFGSTSCSEAMDESIVDRSFLTEQPCSPPCWYGLELGKSTEEDMYTTLKSLPFVDQTTIVERGATWQSDENARSITFDCLHPWHGSKWCGDATFSADKLTMLWLSVNYDLTFETVVQRLGTPDYISYGPYHVEVGGCEVLLYWPKSQICVDSLDTTGDRVCRMLNAGQGIDPAAKVSNIIYMVHEAFPDGPEEGLPYAPWPGFAQ